MIQVRDGTVEILRTGANTTVSSFLEVVPILCDPVTKVNWFQLALDPTWDFLIWEQRIACFLCFEKLSDLD